MGGRPRLPSLPPSVSSSTGLAGAPLSDGRQHRISCGGAVRSFQEDYLGPRDPYVPDQPWGGRAVIVYNQEIRFPIRALSKRIALKGVLFHDAGNIFREVSELRAFDVRRSAGIGLRLDTPFSLFRLDYAVTIDPRPEENRNRWIFSLGQMF